MRRAGALAVALACWAGPAAADGRQLAAACAGCHAAESGAIPALDGRSGDAMEAALMAYRSGARPSQIMEVVARALSPAEIAAVSRYLAAERVP